MWAPTASPATGRAALPPPRRRMAVVRIAVAVAPAKARPRLCLAVPPASDMSAAAAAKEEEEEEMGWRKAVELDAAARREMAIRRLQEEAGTGTGSSRREFAVFETARGDALFTQSWTPVAAAAADRVNGRYNHFAKILNDHGLKVYAMDWIGHGGSDGVHGYVSSLDHAVGDLKEFLEDIVLEENYGLPCFLFGHSTGGAIVLKAALDPCVEVHVEGVILTSPAIHVQPAHPIIKVVAPIFSVLAPKYRVAALHRRGPPVSRDPEALKIKYADPLVYTGPIRVRTGNEILRISSYLQRNLSRVTVPFLVLHGTADTITDPRASQRLYQSSASAHKSIKLYDGYLHDLLFEPERDDIANDIINWLSSRLNVLQRW
ncbi:monoacylglycerol lipase-like isoform X2 [Oryza brachyantha]|uniref:monoacylglycerol lipase-like isoform X2 n=1 Tax=Oryza brachyantha TaxID=4533 RepID=UPI001ADA0565|nr:monoacylglycerol lipase-like isoform X2 [Oryza brachyantha]